MSQHKKTEHPKGCSVKTLSLRGCVAAVAISCYLRFFLAAGFAGGFLPAGLAGGFLPTGFLGSTGVLP